MGKNHANDTNTRSSWSGVDRPWKWSQGNLELLGTAISLYLQLQSSREFLPTSILPGKVVTIVLTLAYGLV